MTTKLIPMARGRYRFLPPTKPTLWQRIWNIKPKRRKIWEAEHELTDEEIKAGRTPDFFRVNNKQINKDFEI